ncbi:MAG TPA: hypothetical protein VIR81_12280 [Myxococcales bacterium]
MNGNGKAEPRPPREIERDIEHLRTRLDRSLAELDRRRHELTDVRLQMQRHPGVFIGAGAAVALMIGGVAFAVWRSRKREELPQKARRLRIAVRRAVDDPKKVARGEAPVWEKIIAAVGTTIAVNLTKKMLDRAWSSTELSRRR